MLSNPNTQDAPETRGDPPTEHITTLCEGCTVDDHRFLKKIITVGDRKINLFKSEADLIQLYPSTGTAICNALYKDNIQTFIDEEYHDLTPGTWDAIQHAMIAVSPTDLKIEFEVVDMFGSTLLYINLPSSIMSIKGIASEKHDQWKRNGVTFYTWFSEAANPSAEQDLSPDNSELFSHAYSLIPVTVSSSPFTIIEESMYHGDIGYGPSVLETYWIPESDISCSMNDSHSVIHHVNGLVTKEIMDVAIESSGMQTKNNVIMLNSQGIGSPFILKSSLKIGDIMSGLQHSSKHCKEKYGNCGSITGHGQVGSAE